MDYRCLWLGLKRVDQVQVWCCEQCGEDGAAGADGKVFYPIRIGELIDEASGVKRCG